MYRTEQWLQSESRLDIPLVIPSYHRPDAPIFTRRNTLYTCGLVPKDRLFIAVRREDMPNYSHLTNATLLPLDNVFNLASTRQAILDYFHQMRAEYVIMCDDRTTRLSYLVPKKSKRSGKITLQASGNNLEALLVWQHILKEYKLTLTSPAHSGFSWNPDHIDSPYYINSGNAFAGFVAYRITDIYDNSIRYDTSILVEDVPFALDVLSHGLPTCQITDLEFSEVASRDISGKGGCHDDMSYYDRCEHRIDDFRKSRWADMEGTGWGIYTEHSKGEVKSHQLIVRYRYWRDFYRKNGQRSFSGLIQQK